MAAAEVEPRVQALRYIVRNETLPSRLRLKARLALTQIPVDSRLNSIRNRCIETGRGRGIMRDFRLCRVSLDWGKKLKC